MSKTLTDRTIALAGLLQAVALVAQTANRGTVDPAPLETVIRSLFVRSPEETVDVYGDLGALRLGLQTLIGQLGANSSGRDMEIARYAMTLLHLERQLGKRKDLLEQIGTGLEGTERQLAHFHLTHETIMASLADIYVNTVSTLPPRIMVSGEHGHLQRPEIANRVRALLLAGMRAAVLWTQCGGNRWQLLFRRKALVNEATRLLAQI